MNDQYGLVQAQANAAAQYQALASYSHLGVQAMPSKQDIARAIYMLPGVMGHIDSNETILAYLRRVAPDAILDIPSEAPVDETSQQRESRERAMFMAQALVEAKAAKKAKALASLKFWCIAAIMFSVLMAWGLGLLCYLAAELSKFLILPALLTGAGLIIAACVNWPSKPSE